MKILVLDEFLCYPPDSGKKVRTYNILKQLSTHHEITLLCFVWGDPNENESIKQLQSLGIRVVTVKRNNPAKSGLIFYLRLLKNLFSPLPYIVAGHLKKIYAEKLKEIIAEWKPDILLAEWSPYAVYLEKIKNIPRVAGAHNLESSIWRGYVEKSSPGPKRWYLNLQYRKVVRFEKELFDWLDGLIVVSPVELDYIKKSYPRLKSSLVDNGVDLEYFSPGSEKEDDDVISFVGSLDWRPNQDGVVYFIEEILPLLRKKAASIKVLIIGRGAPDWLISLGQKHEVEFTGAVDDVRPHVRRSAVSIVPLRIGGGSRLKILEAFSMAKAVVSTTLGAEGLRIENNKHLLIADQPEQFADAIVELLDNKDKRRLLGDEGKRLVSEKYRWEKLALIQSEFLNSLVKRQQ